MQQKSVTVFTKIRAKAGTEETVRKMLLAMREASVNEKGCARYELHYSSEDRSQFLFFEHWLTRADFEKHLRMPLLQEFLAASESLLAEPVDITFWEPMG